MSHLALGQILPQGACVAMQVQCDSLRDAEGALRRQLSQLKNQAWELSRSDDPGDQRQSAELSEQVQGITDKVEALDRQREHCYVVWRSQCAAPSRPVEGSTAGARVHLPAEKTVEEARIEYEVAQRPVGESVERATARARSLERDPTTSWAVESRRFQQRQRRVAQELLRPQWSTGAKVALGAVVLTGILGAVWLMRSG